MTGKSDNDFARVYRVEDEDSTFCQLPAYT